MAYILSVYSLCVPTNMKSISILGEMFGDMVLILEVEDYVTEQRLANVARHIGEEHVPKDFGKIMGHISKDVLEDFLQGPAIIALPYQSKIEYHY